MNSGTTSDQISLFIIGAQKAGTTSLKQYLGEHPEITTHYQKEFAYFYDEAEYKAGKEAAFRKYFGATEFKKKLLAKNAGLYVNENGLKRLKENNPDCHLVLLLRNPVDRAYSAFQMERNYGNFSGEFDEIREIVKSASGEDWRFEFFIRMGMYVDYLEVLYQHFSRDQVSLYRFEDLANDPKKICAELFGKLGVDASFVPDTSVKHNVTHKMRSTGYARFVKRLLNNSNPIKKVARTLLPGQRDYKLGEIMRNVNKSTNRPTGMSDAVRIVLTDFYRPYNERLSNLTGMDFSSWNSRQK